MISVKIVPLILLVAGWAVFLTPQSLPRRWVKNWSGGYAAAFWLTKVLALVLIVLGAAGLLLRK